MQISFSPPDMSQMEIEGVADTIQSGWITTGPKTKEFEKKIAEYCGSDKAVCLNSATACLEAALSILGIGPGDEVITSAYTYTASASPVCHLGAKLILIDVKENSYEMNYDLLEKAISKNTKAIIPIDLGGILCDYNKIFSILERKSHLFSPKNEIQERIGRVVVVADGAHAFGAMKNDERCGTIADFTSFSFHAVKNLTTAEGGALTWKSIEGIDNEMLYKQFMLYSLHGQSKDAFAKTQLGSWEYDILAPAYKCNMTDIMAAIGLAQLKRYPDMLKRRKEIISEYNKEFLDYDVDIAKHYEGDNDSSGHLYLMRIPRISMAQRNELIVDLAELGIATNVHYKPLPMMTAYKNMGFNIEDYPNSYIQFENEITLPLHTCLKDIEIEYIVENTKKYLNVLR